MRWIFLVLWAAVFLLMTALLADESAPLLPPGAVRMSPPEEYRKWFARTEVCAERLGHFENIEWYVVPGEKFDAEGPRLGMWAQAEWRLWRVRREVIVLAGAARTTEWMVRHEMLHSILGHTGHPAEYFVDRCHLTWGNQ